MSAAQTASVWPQVRHALIAAAIGALVMTLVAQIIGVYWLRYYLIEFGILTGFGWSLLKHWQARFAALDSHVRQLTITLSKLAPGQGATAAAAQPSPPPSSAPSDVSTATAAPAVGTTASETVATAAAHTTTPRPTQAQPAQPGWLASRIEAGLAWFKRGNPMARIGIVVLFFGGAFLARYAAESGFFPIELRLMALVVGAMALLGIGWRLRDTNRNYGLILQGGGIAVLYLTVFAALKLYGLVTTGFALPLMIVIALAAAVLAVAQNALVLAVIGFSGGFLAPILTSTGSGSHIALFSYYTVLNLGLFAIAWFRAWRVLNLIGFLFTFGVAGAFRASSYTAADRLSTDVFLLLFFVMYIAISVLFSLRQPPKLKGYVSGSLVFGLPVAAFTLHASLVSSLSFGLAWSALGFGVFYLVLASLLLLLRNPNLRLLSEAFAALGVVFASLAVPLAFDERTTAAMWAVEGAGLLWIGMRQDRKLARAFGALLQLLAGLGFLAGMDGLPAQQALLNSAWIGAVLLAASGFVSGLWLSRHSGVLAPYERGAEFVAGLWGISWWFFGGLSEIERFVLYDYRLGASLAFVGLSLLVLHGLGARLRWTLPGRTMLGVLALALLAGLLASAKHGAHPFALGGWFGWPLLLLAGYALLYRQDIAPDDRAEAFTQWLHPILLWVLALVGGWEASWQVAQQAEGVWAQLPAGLVVAGLLWLLTQQLPPWPLARHAALYRLRGALPLLAWLLWWSVLLNLSSDGDPIWLPYLPLLNPLDVAVALCALVGAGWWFALDDSTREQVRFGHPRLMTAVLCAIVLLWLSASLVRGLHYSLGTPLDYVGIRNDARVHAGLSIFWGLLGFSTMLLATRRGWRAAWMAGAGLMAVVVIKLFVFDLDDSSPLTRIVSFITVGILMLITGYFSPLPPRNNDKEAHA